MTDDFDRILNHLLENEVEGAASRVREIISAIDVLGHSPLIGRPIRPDLSELVIGRGAQAYVALYRYIEGVDTAFVLAIRGRKESGYRQ